MSRAALVKHLDLMYLEVNILTNAILQAHRMVAKLQRNRKVSKRYSANSMAQTFALIKELTAERTALLRRIPVCVRKLVRLNSSSPSPARRQM